MRPLPPEAEPQGTWSGLVELWAEPALSGILAGGYLILLTLMWVMLVVGVGRWGRRFVLQPERVVPPELPFVSVCIPARDEAHNIGTCVAAALTTRLENFEVVVVDDRSSDGTGDAARAADDGSGRLRVVEGTEPPEGWAGKPWACARAAGEARGALLCFVDADVRLDARAVGALAAELEAHELGLISAFGTWELVSWWERVVIPAVGWLIRGSVDLERVHQPSRLEAFANGQVLMVERGAYQSVGGHEAVKAEVLDDVRLARALKRRGHRIGLRVAPWAFRVRLYRSLSEIVSGYGKNLYEGMDRRSALGLGAILFIGVGTLLPWMLLIASLISRLALGWGLPGAPWVVWLGALCALQILFRWRLDRADGRSGRDAWTHPIANVVLVAILTRAVFGVRSTWKGRRFEDGQAVSAER